MDYFGLGDKIDYNTYNGLVYLLRKFKCLKSNLKLGNKVIESDYGTYNIIGGLESIEGNWILEDDVNIISNNCLLNAEYTFTFTIIDVNTSGIVNKREKSFSGLTGETGELNITIPEDTLNSDEQILSDFTVDIIFDEHEYYTPPSDINVNLSVDKSYISDDESATVTALITSDDGTPIESSTVNFNVNGTITSKTTDSTGKATLTITGDGTQGLLNINVLTETITVIDAYFFDKNNNDKWWNQNGDYNVSINNDGFKHLLLLTDGDRVYVASTAPSIDSAPPLNELLSISTPFCVEFDTGAVNYPNNIPSFALWDTDGNIVFKFQLFMYTHYKIQIEDNTIKIWKNNEYIEYSLEIPGKVYVGFSTESNKINAYVDFKDLVIYNLSEPAPPSHDYSLSLTGTSIIQTGDNATVTATLLDNGVAAVGETLNYEIKHGSTVIDSGSSTTDVNGQVMINYTGAGVGDVDVIVSYGSLLQETYEIEDCVRYFDSTYSSNTTFNVSLPSTFKIEYDCLINDQTHENSAYLNIGESTSRSLLVGKVMSMDSNWKVVVRTSASGSGDIITSGSAISPSNDWQPIIITYDGTTFNFNNDISVTNFNGVSLDKLNSYNTWKNGTTSGNVRNIKIKAL